VGSSNPNVEVIEEGIQDVEVSGFIVALCALEGVNELITGSYVIKPHKVDE